MYACFHESRTYYIEHVRLVHLYERLVQIIALQIEIVEMFWNLAREDVDTEDLNSRMRLAYLITEQRQ